MPESISQVIAAGEVIERPASVVKELMENAVDAGSSEITVELKAGGLQLIRVADSGEGMDQEDVPLAFQRYATSKIERAEDLYAIRTLGFRGEALPSISQVSRMTLLTRTPHSISGTKVICEGGEIKNISETRLSDRNGGRSQQPLLQYSRKKKIFEIDPFRTSLCSKSLSPIESFSPRDFIQIHP